MSERSNTAQNCSVTIVIPTYREVENLRPLLIRISDAMSKAKGSYEIIFVDDDSRHGTDRVIRELNEFGYPVRLITRVGERGLSSAVIRGFSEANGETFLCLDADLSHPPEAIPAILERLDETAVDFVLGSRYVPGGAPTNTGGYCAGSIVK